MMRQWLIENSELRLSPRRCMAGGQSDYRFDLSKYSQLRKASDEVRQRDFGLF